MKLPGQFELCLIQGMQNDMLERAKAGEEFAIHFVNYVHKCVEKLKTQGG